MVYGSEYEVSLITSRHTVISTRLIPSVLRTRSSAHKALLTEDQHGQRVPILVLLVAISYSSLDIWVLWF